VHAVGDCVCGFDLSGATFVSGLQCDICLLNLCLSLDRPIANGSKLSLQQLGYNHVGIDDGWQECGAGSELPTSFHDAAGTPLVNKSRCSLAETDIKLNGAYATPL
jgi:hypothetical protein